MAVAKHSVSKSRIYNFCKSSVNCLWSPFLDENVSNRSSTAGPIRGSISRTHKNLRLCELRFRPQTSSPFWVETIWRHSSGRKSLREVTAYFRTESCQRQRGCRPEGVKIVNFTLPAITGMLPVRVRTISQVRNWRAAQASKHPKFW